MNMDSNQLHARENHGLLAAAEKRLLLHLAGCVPAQINSDHLTVLGLFGMFMAGLSFWAASQNRILLVFVIVALGINWLGDSLDGTLARVRNLQRPRFGYYADHVLDLAGTTALLGGLALSSFMSPIVALGLLSAYLLVTAEVFLATHTSRTFRMSFLAFGPTELRIVLAIGTLCLIRRPFVYIAGHGPFLLFDVGGIVSIAGLITAFLFSAGRNICVLYNEEPLPQTRAGK
jgi:phosphatidylglycerophosphate synthase